MLGLYYSESIIFLSTSSMHENLQGMDAISASTAHAVIDHVDQPSQHSA